MTEAPRPAERAPPAGPWPSSDSSWTTTSALTLLLAVSVYGFVGYQLYRALSRPVDVSLSAEYEPYSRWLTVRGGAYSEAKPVESGTAKVVFETSYPNATHSFHVPVQRGKFAVDAQVGAIAARPGTFRRVTAFVETEPGGGTGVGKVLGPNEVDGWILSAVVAIWIVLVGTFVWWFTGEYSRVKQRYAIIYSYMLAALFLIVPLAIPIAVVVMPGLAPVLAKTPVGFLRVGAATVGSDRIRIDQWSLNIGGTPAVHVQPPRSEGTPESPPEPKSEPSHAEETPAAIAAAKPDAPAAEGGAVSDARARLGELARHATGRLSGAGSGTAQPTDPTAAGLAALEPDAPDSAITYDVTGGLVVPLYVVILATIGGAFRMTRAVPVIERKIRAVESRRFQRVAVSVKDWIAVPMQAALAPFGGFRSGRERNAPPERAVAVHGTEIETKVEQEIIRSEPNAAAVAPETAASLAESAGEAERAAASVVVAAGGDAEPDRAEHSTKVDLSEPVVRGKLEDELALAREELTHQVLFLFTSPFMGILAYYALVFIHAEFGTKTPIVAIVAFVSGIKSEDVLQKIVELAQGHLTGRKEPT
jgi:hypothetical protein